MIVAKFLSWIETAPVERRAEATSALARAYLFSQMESHERQSAETALTILLDDPSPLVRASLSDSLASSPYAPHHVILSLAQDLDEIAEPVLQRSPVLLDAELVDIAANGTDRLQVAIAKRPSVSAALAAALAEVGDKAACLAILGNSGAQVTVFSLRRMAERFGKDADMRTALLSLDGLPVDIRQSLIVQLGDALEQLALVQTFVSSERRSSLVKDACDKATIDLAFCSHGDELVALVEHLRLSKQLTADILIRGLCMGNVELFVIAMTSLTGLPDKRIRDCVNDASYSAVAALCHKAGMSESVVPAIVSALEAFHDLVPDLHPEASRARFARLMVERILSSYTGIVDDEMDDLHALLRRFATQIARDEAREMRAQLQREYAA
ncbi:MAG: DUF2336 domain-containing protein [Cohaesibacter sp.]|jgi:uncharacterized protein (DUF2336 family)|nr:DUF2336 domain-containing protein [Cohaesibacter sp.]